MRALLAYVLVMFRRRWPLPVALVTTALGVVSGVSAGPATLAAVSLATRRRILPVALVGVVSVVAAQGYTDTQPLQTSDPVWLTVLLNVTITVAMLGWGMYIGSRRELLWTLRERADRAEAEQQLRVDNARNHERARIAREMHDVLAHRISQVSMHAGALAYREDLSADEIRGSAGVIQAMANEALNDLRAVLGVLRAPDSGELVDRPQPTYDDLPALIEESREGGMHIEYTDLLKQEPALPVAVGSDSLPDHPGGAHERTQARTRCARADPSSADHRTTASTCCCATPSGSPRLRLLPAPGSAWSAFPNARSSGADVSNTGRTARRSCCTAGYRGPHEHPPNA